MNAQERLDYYIEHLELFGNTSSSVDPAPYVDALREKGWEIEYRKEILFTNDDLRTIVRSKKYCYIITGKRIEKENNDETKDIG